ncbi:1,6-anhydro-N-acetylmuramyl-L-alanine amidase AmpD [Neptunomonas phycophila]|nr:1,6-anhydro-N-acetylmuramyl-L-alanine amidase AmpD [Neptunomonas phycophila]MDO6467343.1 1,6-anhydro-N-acetylmuramyl-L-alanine amidase AmpD [Neptunomonas phycophila]
MTLSSIENGLVVGARWLASPNFNERPVATNIDLLVVHNISLPPGEFENGYVEAFFQNRLVVQDHPYFSEIAHLQVSAHLLIARSGIVTQFVNLNDRAWHAGVSCFDGVESCNDFSIGIELEGTDYIPFTDEQYASLTSLTKLIQEAYPSINSHRITGHSDIAPGRKTDPGPCFDWLRYRASLGR